MSTAFADANLSIGDLLRGFGLPWLFVIDDFLRDPDAVRNRALQLNYVRPGHYPGLTSEEKIELPGLTQIISQLVHEPLHTPWSPGFAHQRCRLSLAADDKPGRVHIDTSHWTGVLSLSQTDDGSSATEFFRHRPTGTDHLPLTAEALGKAGYKTYEEMNSQILEKDALDPDQWEQTVRIPLRYNRLILLQPHYWHTAGPGFGSGVEDGRLVFLMFFNRTATGGRI